MPYKATASWYWCALARNSSIVLGGKLLHRRSRTTFCNVCDGFTSAKAFTPSVVTLLPMGEHTIRGGGVVSEPFHWLALLPDAQTSKVWTTAHLHVLQPLSLMPWQSLQSKGFGTWATNWEPTPLLAADGLVSMSWGKVPHQLAKKPLKESGVNSSWPF